MVLITALVNVDVFSAAVFNKPLVFVSELCEYALVYVTFLGAAWLLRINGHVKIDSLVVRLPHKAQVSVELVSVAMCIIMCIVLMIYATIRTVDFIATGYVAPRTIYLPLAYIIWTIPAGFLCLVIQFIRNGLIVAKGWKGKVQITREELNL